MTTEDAGELDPANESAAEIAALEHEDVMVEATTGFERGAPSGAGALSAPALVGNYDEPDGHAFR